VLVIFAHELLVTCMSTFHFFFSCISTQAQSNYFPSKHLKISKSIYINLNIQNSIFKFLSFLSFPFLCYLLSFYDISSIFLTIEFQYLNMCLILFLFLFLFSFLFSHFSKKKRWDITKKQERREREKKNETWIVMVTLI
jgi:hypothetical protein